jgi:hypothetical protein
VEGESEDGLGEMTLFLPDDTGIEEAAADLRQLLFGDSGAAGAGVRALEAGGYDWAMAEVVLDDSQVTVSADGSEEMEAVLVVPEAGTSGEVLWGRTRPMIDEGRALYATVKVKRTAPTSGATRRTPKVTAPPAQVKRGRELKFEPFDLCPYQNYGRVAAFRRALCYKWERQAAQKVQKVAFDRTIKNLPEIRSQLPAAAQQSSKITGVVGNDRGLLVYNPKNLGPDELKKLFDSTASGAAALSEEGQVEGQQVYELLKIFLDFIKDLVQQWQKMGQEEQDAFKRALLGLQVCQVYEDPVQCARRYCFRIEEGKCVPYDSEEARAFAKVVNGIAKALQNYLGFTDPNLALAEALRIMGKFASTLRTDQGLLTAIVEQAGVAGIIAFVKLMEQQTYACSRYVYPTDIASFFGKLLELKGILGKWDLFLEHLAAAAAQAAANMNRDAALEMIARLYLLQELFSKMKVRGWQRLECGYTGGAGWAGPFFDFYGWKQFDVSGIGEYRWHIMGWVEPYLSLGDLDRILRQIENAADWILRSLPLRPGGWGPFYPSGKQAIVQVINNSDLGAVEALCGRLGSYGVPVVIIAGGQVACYSGISPQGAQDICEQMGYCNSSTASSSQDGASADPPEGTYSVPFADPNTGLCPPGWSFCMI